MTADSALENAGRTGTTSARVGSGVSEGIGTALTTGMSSLGLFFELSRTFILKDGPLPN